MYEIKFKTTVEDKKVTLTHLVESLIPFDALTVLEIELEGLDHEVISLKKSNIQEVILRPENRINVFFKVTVKIVEVDENSGKEKAKNVHFLIEADNTKEAEIIMHKERENWLIDSKIKSINESPICLFIK